MTAALLIMLVLGLLLGIVLSFGVKAQTNKVTGRVDCCLRSREYRTTRPARIFYQEKGIPYVGFTDRYDSN